MTERGFGAFVRGEETELTPDELRVLHCWRFMGGLFLPGALTAYLAIYPFDDPEVLVTGLMELRDARKG